MDTIQIRARVDASGNITIPVGVSEAGEEVEVLVKPMRPSMTQSEWTAFIERTAGSIPDLQRPPQWPVAEREPLD